MRISTPLNIILFQLIMLVGNLLFATKHSLNGNGIGFTPNKGQLIDVNGNLRPDILYKGDAGGMDVYIKQNGLSYVLHNINKLSRDAYDQTEQIVMQNPAFSSSFAMVHDSIMSTMNLQLHRVDISFVKANEKSIFIEEQIADGYFNFYFAHCPNGITHVNQYNLITQKNIYNNIDVIYHGSKAEGLKYDIVVNPGGKPSEIVMEYDGMESLTLENGVLKVSTSLGELNEHLPKVYQIINNQISDVRAEYILQGNHVRFKLGKYNSHYPLIIDPWATYYGSNSIEYSTGLSIDNNGSTFISGTSCSATFPVSTGAFQVNYGGGSNTGLFYGDAVIVKFNPSGNRLWATFFGGSGDDPASGGITTDNLGSCAILGQTTSNNLPISASIGNSVQQSTSSGSLETYIAKFDANGQKLWSTYLGGNRNENAGRTGIASDNNNNIIVTGHTDSQNFPIITTTGNVSLHTSNAGGLGVSDLFLAKYNSTGSMLWSTYFGGSNFEYGYFVTIDSQNNIIFGGMTTSNNYPTGSSGSYVIQQNALSGSSCGVVNKLAPNGSLLFASYYGTRNYFYNATTDNLDNIIVAGVTSSNIFPTGATTGNVVYQNTYGGGTYDDVIVKFSPNGNRLWATYFGSNQTEFDTKLATDPNNNIFLLTEAEDVATPNLVNFCTYQPIFNGGVIPTQSNYWPQDQLIVKFLSNGQHTCTTYLGGTGEDDMDFGSGFGYYNGNLYVTGETDGGYPVSSGAWQTTYSGPSMGLYLGGVDIFVNVICANICEGKNLGLTITADSTTACINSPITYSANMSFSCDTSGYKYHWSFPGGNPSVSTVYHPVVKYPSSGLHIAKLVLSTPCKTDSAQTTITIISCGCQPSYSSLAPVACNSYIAPSGKLHTSSANFNDTITNVYGCDSIISINLTIKNNASAVLNLSPACDSLFAKGKWHYFSQIVHDTIPGGSVNGCDSITITNIIIHHTSTSNVNPITCTSYLSPSGKTYTSSGTYLDTLANTLGCDSIITINLTIRNGAKTIFNPFPACDSLLVKGKWFYSSQTLHDTLFGGAASGCDSIIITNIIIHNTSKSSISPFGCTSYTSPSGKTFTSSGTYIDTIPNALGCDSIITINLVMSTPVYDTLHITACDRVIFNGVSYFNDSTFTLNNHTTKGCDSLTTVFITVYPQPVGNFTTSPNPATLLSPTVFFHNLSSPDNLKYYWSFGDASNATSTEKNPSHTYQDTGFYLSTLIITNNYGCADTIEQLIVINDDYSIYVPNTFTPNSDGINDVFLPKGVGIIERGYELLIFDRWGNLIFKTNDLNKGWDGKANDGKDIAQIDTYVWKLGFTDIFETKHFLVGHVNLIK